MEDFSRAIRLLVRLDGRHAGRREQPSSRHRTGRNQMVRGRV